MLFAGPIGVSKTEFSKALAEFLGYELLTLRMQDFKKLDSVSRLLGSPPGYEGYNNNGGQLTKPLLNNPRTVVLLDEVEEADPEVIELFMSVLDEGELQASTGKVVKFNQAVIIWTTNGGAEELAAGMSVGDWKGLMCEPKPPFGCGYSWKHKWLGVFGTNIFAFPKLS